MTLKIEKTLTLNPMCVKHTKNGRAAARTAGKEPRARGGGGGGGRAQPLGGGPPAPRAERRARPHSGAGACTSPVETTKCTLQLSLVANDSELATGT